ncbi:MAG: hypothetical protein AAF485_30360 [Chloroflexota bacterium]
MAIFTNQQYSNEDIVIDGNTYNGCSFSDCRLIYKGGDSPNFNDCTVRKSDLQLEGSAANTTEYLQSLYQVGLRGGVDRILDGINSGNLPISGRVKFPPPSHLGDNYGSLARSGGILAVIVALLAAALWYGFNYYPTNVILESDPARPLFNASILDVVPVLPEDLADIYDEIKAGQIEQISSYGEGVDGTAQIPVDEAINLIAETGMPVFESSE